MPPKNISINSFDYCVCVNVSTWTRCVSSSTRTFDICSTHRASRCMTYRPTLSTLTTSTRSIQTLATTRRNSTDSEWPWSVLLSHSSVFLLFVSLPLTLWRPLLPYATKHLLPDWVRLSFVIFDIRALGRSGLNNNIVTYERWLMSICVRQSGLFDIHSIKRYWKDMENGHRKCTCNGPGKSLLAEKLKTNFLWR